MGRADRVRYLVCIAVMSLLAVYAVVVPTLASAQVTVQNLTVNTSFSCSGGSPVGSVLTGAGGNCFTSPDISIFSRMLCVFHSTVSEIMARFYCGVVDAMKLPVMALATIFISVFATSFMLGIIQFSAREAMIVLFKIALIMGFALNAELAIGVGYNFFISFASQMTDMFLGAMGFSSAGALIAEPDQMLQGIGNALTEQGGGGQQGGGTSSSTIPERCKQVLIVMLLLMVIVMPILVLLVFGAVLSYIVLAARAAFGYLYSFSMLSFLFALSPIFISFALFKFTKSIFDRWLSYLGVHAIQIVIIFAFLALVVSMDLVKAVMEILSMLRVYRLEISVLGYNVSPFDIDICSFCKYSVKTGGELVCASNGEAMHFMDAITDGVIMRFILTKIMAFYVIGWVLEKFLLLAPEMAKELAGGEASSNLSGNPANLSSVGMDALNPAGIERVEAGLSGFRTHARSVKTITDIKLPKRPRTALQAFSYIPRLLSRNLGVNAAATAFANYGKSKAEINRDDVIKSLHAAKREREKAQKRRDVVKSRLDLLNNKFDKYEKTKSSITGSADIMSRADRLAEKIQKMYDKEQRRAKSAEAKFRRGEISEDEYKKSLSGLDKQKKRLDRVLGLRKKAKEEYDEGMGAISEIIDKFSGKKKDSQEYAASVDGFASKKEFMDKSRRVAKKSQMEYDKTYNDFIKVAEKFKNGEMSKAAYDSAYKRLSRQAKRLGKHLDIAERARAEHDDARSRMLAAADKLVSNSSDGKKRERAEKRLARRERYLEDAEKAENLARSGREATFLEGRRRKRLGFFARKYEERYGRDYRYVTDIWNSARLAWAEEMYEDKGMKAPSNMDQLRKSSSIIDRAHTMFVRNRYKIFGGSYTSDGYKKEDDT